MTAIAFADEQAARAERIARRIGCALRDVRRTRGESIADVCARLSIHPTNLGRIERGEEPNLKLGNALEMLDDAGLTLVVARKPIERVVINTVVYSAVLGAEA